MNVKALSLRSLQVHLKVAIVALCMAAALFAMPHPAQADGLTEPQIQAVLGLLSAFDVPQATIDNVSNILHGTTQVNGPSVDIKAAQSDGPIGVGSGTSVMLSWITSNVNECRITSLPDTGQWRGGVDVGSTGSQSTGPISGTVTYRLRCAPVSGASVVSHSVTIQVTNTTDTTTTNGSTSDCRVDYPEGANIRNSNQSSSGECRSYCDTYGNADAASHGGEAVCRFRGNQIASYSATPTPTPSCVLDATRNASTGIVTFSWTTQNARSFSLSPIAGGTHWVTPASSGSWTYSTSVNTTTTFTGTATDANASHYTCTKTVWVTNQTTQTNGVCGSANGTTVSSAPSSNLCAPGTGSSGTVTGNGPWNWTCAGIGGGTTAQCSASKPVTAPAAPAGLSAVCGTTGAGVQLNWNSVGGASSYLLRLDDMTNNSASCTDGWLCSSPDMAASNVQLTSYGGGGSYAVVPGHANRFWVHSTDANGNQSAASEQKTFTCASAAASSCSNGLSITQYQSCSCPSGQVQTGSVCTSTAPLLSGVTNVTTFWSALYACIQTRNATESEISYWVGQTGSGVTSLSAAYRSFFGSTEDLNKQTSNQTYLTQLNQCVLFRSPDSSGYAYWLNQLQGGSSRDA